MLSDLVDGKPFGLAGPPISAAVRAFAQDPFCAAAVQYGVLAAFSCV